jgi:hypothetical protein
MVMTAQINLKQDGKSYAVPFDLFCSYVQMMNAMKSNRSLCHYKTLDILRESIHDSILIAAGTDRTDKVFSFLLAAEAESVIDQMGNAA